MGMSPSSSTAGRPAIWLTWRPWPRQFRLFDIPAVEDTQRPVERPHRKSPPSGVQILMSRRDDWLHGLPLLVINLQPATNRDKHTHEENLWREPASVLICRGQGLPGTGSFSSTLATSPRRRLAQGFHKPLPPNRAHLPLSGKKSGLGPARVVIHDRGRADVQAFCGLTGDLGDEVEVLIEVQYGQSGEFSSRGDDQIRY
jgi:hypothetical protein